MYIFYTYLSLLQYICTVFTWVRHRLLPLLLAGEEHDTPHEDQAARRHQDADTCNPESVYRDHKPGEQEAEADNDKDDEDCLDDPPWVSPPEEFDPGHPLWVRYGHTVSCLSLNITDVPHLQLLHPVTKLVIIYSTCVQYPNVHTTSYMYSTTIQILPAQLTDGVGHKGLHSRHSVCTKKHNVVLNCPKNSL